MNLCLEQDKIGVIGAAGKMGRGIALLLLQAMARAEAEGCGVMGKKSRALVLIDTFAPGLDRLRSYLKEQLQRYAEKNIVALRTYFASHSDLVSNREIITYFVSHGMEMVHLSSSLGELQGATWCFEAIVEDVEAKVALFSTLDAASDKRALFFTNTSAIPIEVLNQAAHLQGRIIGFHFYNPPAVQTLLELIPLKNGDPGLTALACEIGHMLGKHVVFANDIAGFIGNGYLLREVMAGCRLVQDLQRQGFELSSAVPLLNLASAELCLRPMGIFQLVEYVGFELVLQIGAIMNRYLPTPLYGADLVSFLEACRPFFKHQVPPLSLPAGHVSWKALSKASDPAPTILRYLQQLAKEKTTEAWIAQELLKETASIAEQLVQEGVALSLDDVDTVLKEGFYHLYGARLYGSI